MELNHNTFPLTFPCGCSGLKDMQQWKHSNSKWSGRFLVSEGTKFIQVKPKVLESTRVESPACLRGYDGFYRSVNMGESEQVGWWFCRLQMSSTRHSCGIGAAFLHIKRKSVSVNSCRDCWAELGRIDFHTSFFSILGQNHLDCDFNRCSPSSI